LYQLRVACRPLFKPTPVPLFFIRRAALARDRRLGRDRVPSTVFFHSLKVQLYIINEVF
jgi:hypothetical protein